MSKSLDKMKKIWYNIPDGNYENVFIFYEKNKDYSPLSSFSVSGSVSPIAYTFTSL